jgi:hypothetical protein
MRVGIRVGQDAIAAILSAQNPRATAVAIALTEHELTAFTGSTIRTADFIHANGFKPLRPG